MKINKNSSGGDFVPHPETLEPVRGVFVDITEPVPKQTPFGERKFFSIVIESEVKDSEGKNYAVWENGLTPSLNEKSNLRKFLKSAFGRDVAETEADEKGDLDIDKLCLGHPVKFMIAHRIDEGKTYANITAIFPDNSATPFRGSGTFIRKKDRKEGDGKPGQPFGSAAAPPASWRDVVIHVGNNKGKTLGSVDDNAVKALIERWLPGHAASQNPLPMDSALASALLEAQSTLWPADPF